MDPEIEKKIYQDIGDDDIKRMIKNVIVKPYHELKSYKNIEELFHLHGLKQLEPLILLYEHMRNTGHFVVLQLRPYKEGFQYLEYFDPLGFGIDELLKWWHKKVPPYLTRLIHKSGIKVVHNHIAVQNRDVNTCGRHCVTRLKNNRMSLSDYILWVVQKKPNPDYYVTKFTNQLEYGGSVDVNDEDNYTTLPGDSNMLVLKPGLRLPRKSKRSPRGGSVDLDDEDNYTTLPGDSNMLVMKPGLRLPRKSKRSPRGGGLDDAYGDWVATLNKHLEAEAQLKGGGLKKAKANWKKVKQKAKSVKKKPDLKHKDKVIDHQKQIEGLKELKSVFGNVDKVNNAVAAGVDQEDVEKSILGVEERKILDGKSDAEIVELYKEVQIEMVELMTEAEEVDKHIENLKKIQKKTAVDSEEFKESRKLMKQALSRKKQLIDEQKWFFQRPSTQAAVGKVILDMGYGVGGLAHKFGEGAMDLYFSGQQLAQKAKGTASQGMASAASSLVGVGGLVAAGTIGPAAGAAMAVTSLMGAGVSYLSPEVFNSEGGILSSAKGWWYGDQK